MSARARCRICGWHRHYRNQSAGLRAARNHTCPTRTRTRRSQ